MSINKACAKWLADPALDGDLSVYRLITGATVGRRGAMHSDEFSCRVTVRVN